MPITAPRYVCPQPQGDLRGRRLDMASWMVLLLVSCFAVMTSGGLRTAQPQMMAGFGASKKGSGAGAKTKSTAPVALSPKKQWGRFKEHRAQGIDATIVYARVRGSEAWYEVGEVTASKGPVAAGVQVQKRLILEHAVRVHPQLLAKARELECGIEVDGATQVHARCDPIAATNAGFVGRADSSGRYGKSEAAINEKEATSLRAHAKSVQSALEVPTVGAAAEAAVE